MPMISFYFSKHDAQFQAWHPWQWWVFIGILVIGIIVAIVVAIKTK